MNDNALAIGSTFEKVLRKFLSCINSPSYLSCVFISIKFGRSITISD